MIIDYTKETYCLERPGPMCLHLECQLIQFMKANSIPFSEELYHDMRAISGMDAAQTLKDILEESSLESLQRK